MQTIKAIQVIDALEEFMVDYIETDEEMLELSTVEDMVAFAVSQPDIIEGIAYSFSIPPREIREILEKA